MTPTQALTIERMQKRAEFLATAKGAACARGARGEGAHRPVDEDHVGGGDELHRRLERNPELAARLHPEPAAAGHGRRAGHRGEGGGGHLSLMLHRNQL